VRAIVESGAEVVATGNPGCAMQIRSGLAGKGIEVAHPIDLLGAAYGET
jgi:Fe-S oxidoreductase